MIMTIIIKEVQKAELTENSKHYFAEVLMTSIRN